MSKKNKFKANQQAITRIVQVKKVWIEQINATGELYYYHLTDSLGRTWRTIGYNVTDAIQVFEAGFNEPWTCIIEPAPLYSQITIPELFRMLNMGPKTWDIRNDMQIILHTVERRNQFIARLINVNNRDIFKLLYQMKSEYLQHDPMPEEQFRTLYAVNPVEALSISFLESVDIHTYWEWIQVGGSCEKALHYRQTQPEMSFTQAIEHAEQEARGSKTCV